jgi:hypothetical protein
MKLVSALIKTHQQYNIGGIISNRGQNRPKVRVKLILERENEALETYILSFGGHSVQVLLGRLIFQNVHHHIYRQQGSQESGEGGEGREGGGRSGEHRQQCYLNNNLLMIKISLLNSITWWDESSGYGAGIGRGGKEPLRAMKMFQTKSVQQYYFSLFS